MNLFIADDVGLGKTIEVWTGAARAIDSAKVRKVVVSRRHRWFRSGEELEQRFGLHSSSTTVSLLLGCVVSEATASIHLRRIPAS